MQEMESLVRQVQILQGSVEAMITRGDQLYKLQEERLSILPQLETHLSGAIEEIETTNESLLESLLESESQLDSLKKAVAAQLLIVQQMRLMQGKSDTTDQPPPSQ